MIYEQQKHFMKSVVIKKDDEDFKEYLKVWLLYGFNKHIGSSLLIFQQPSQISCIKMKEKVTQYVNRILKNYSAEKLIIEKFRFL